MVKSMTVTNHLGESLKIELAFPEKSGFALLSIDGLGPSKADINSTELATTDGALYNSARVTSRNIVLSLKYLFAPTVEDVRLKSYKYFPIKKRVKLEIETDTRTCEIYGYVESNVPNVFGKDTSAQISIICPDPYFYGVKKHTTVFSGTEPLFEFPFESSPDFEFSVIRKDTIRSLVYDGEIEVGVVITIQMLGAVENIEIHNATTRESMYLLTDIITTITGSALKKNDIIIITTTRYNKSVMLLREGSYHNIFNCIGRASKWFSLVKGENTFGYKASVGVNNLLFSIENQDVFEGM